MWKKKLIIVLVVGIVSWISVSDVFGKSLVVKSPRARAVATAHHQRRKAFVSPRRSRGRIVAPRHRTGIVVRSPWRRRVFLNLFPTVVVSPTPGVITETTVTAWITNSNGSKTPVTLKQEGPYYIGPSGEYYLGMPTEDQLRVLYGM